MSTFTRREISGLFLKVVPLPGRPAVKYLPKDGGLWYTPSRRIVFGAAYERVNSEKHSKVLLMIVRVLIAQLLSFAVVILFWTRWKKQKKQTA